MEGKSVVRIRFGTSQRIATLTDPQIGEVREFLRYHFPRGTVSVYPVGRGDEILDFESTMGELLDSLGGAE